MTSTLYVEDRYRVTTDALLQADQPDAIPHFAALDAPQQQALLFAWQWLRGDTSFPQSTSGSTGAVKTIILGREQMITSAKLTLAALQLTGRDTALLCLHPQYIGGKMMVVRSLLAGMDLVLVPPSSDPLRHLPFLPDFAAMVPLQIQTLLEKGKACQLNRMKAIIIGGAAVSASLENLIARQLTVPVYSTYGMTETVSHIALRKLTHPQSSPFFQVLGNTQITMDARGCLQMKGEVTQQQWLTTNDLVDIQDERHFRWLGRYDFVINSGGIKVSPEVVEAALEPLLTSYGFGGRFLVTSVPDVRLGERVVLLLEGRKQEAVWEKKVLEQAASQLPPYQAPKEVYYLPVFTETPTGKVQRQTTRQRMPHQP